MVLTSQGFSNLKLGPLAVDLLRRGLAAHEVMDALRRHDRWIDYRQIAILTGEGVIQAHTGGMTGPWAGHLVNGDVVCLGNGLVDGAPLAAMQDTFARERMAAMPARLLAALGAGAPAHSEAEFVPAAVSSALLVRAPGDLAPIDLRVDLARASPAEGGDAIADLDRLLQAYGPLVEIYERRSIAPEPPSGLRAAPEESLRSLEIQK